MTVETCWDIDVLFFLSTVIVGTTVAEVDSAMVSGGFSSSRYALVRVRARKTESSDIISDFGVDSDWRI